MHVSVGTTFSTHFEINERFETGPQLFLVPKSKTQEETQKMSLLLGHPWQSPSHKIQAGFGSTKKEEGRGMVPGVPSVDSGNWGENATVCLIVCSQFGNNVICRILCFMKKFVERITPYTFISHTN